MKPVSTPRLLEPSSLGISVGMLERLIREELPVFARRNGWFELRECHDSTWAIQDMPWMHEGIALHLVHRGMLEQRLYRRPLRVRRRRVRVRGRNVPGITSGEPRRFAAQIHQYRVTETGFAELAPKEIE